MLIKCLYPLQSYLHIQAKMLEKKVMALLILAMAFAMSVTTHGVHQINDITCSEALPLFLPCLLYLAGFGPIDPPPFLCCTGALTVFQRATTTQDRRNLCGCFQVALANSGFVAERAEQLPVYCKIVSPFPFYPNTNCST